MPKNILMIKDVGGRKNLKVLPQRGEIKSFKRDSGRIAQLPGKRVSRTGKVYWETRVNRSDAPNKKT